MRLTLLKFKKVACTILGALILAGCSTDTVAPADDVPESNSASEEFNFNYALLYYYYYLSGGELDEPEVYLESPYKALFSNYPDVADVLVMYASMSDRLTAYYPHAYFDAVQSSITQSDSETKSFGMELDSGLLVKTVYRQGPANSAGIRRGDRILALDSASLDGNDSLYEELLSAKDSDTFLFTVLRESDTSKISLTRETLLAPTVYVDSVSKIPVIRITEFTQQTNGFSSNGTALEFEEALSETDGAASTVLDLRGNPGGTINICTRMAADLLSKGDTVIVEKNWHPTKGRRDSTTSAVISTEKGIGAGRYYVLMLDSNSASCAEIFASAITSNLKSPVVGTNSFGKGIGQTYFVTPDSAFGIATSYLFFDKDGISYHGYGFAPDFEVSDADSALLKAAEIAAAQTAQRTAGYGNEVQPYWRTRQKSSERFSPEEALAELKKGMAIREASDSLR